MIKVIGLNTKVLKKEPFSGSHHGMRFFMRAENDILHVWVYPEPWCFEQTSDDVCRAQRLTLAEELEYWLYDYKVLWRSVSRESELFRIQHVICCYADWLRS